MKMTARDYFTQKLKALAWLKAFRNQGHPRFTFRFASKSPTDLFQGANNDDEPYFYVEVAERDGAKGRFYFNFFFRLDAQNRAIEKVVLQLRFTDDSGNTNLEYQHFAQQIFHDLGDKKSKYLSFDGNTEEEVRTSFINWLTENYQTIVGTMGNAILPENDFNNSLNSEVQLLVNSGIINADEVNGVYQLTDTAFQGAGGQQAPLPKVNPQIHVQDMKPMNCIIFGAPGTGKSHKLEGDRVELFGEHYERVTFYPTYSYAQFVGTYKPVMEPVKDVQGNLTDKKEISYKFVPGPFLRVLVKALNEVPDPLEGGKKKDWCLVIEEINRANAAAVFGDVFQLLDRKGGVSEYSIAASEDVKKFLDESLTQEGKNALCKLAGSLDKLKIPGNMYIWATMNSADQGVFPMDTAFKRRWAFDYIGLNKAAGEDGEGTWTIGMDDKKFTYKWEDFRKYVNRLLALAKVNEDKLMGPFFVKKPGDGVIPAPEFKSKVLMYLWEDAGKMCRRQLFGEIATYSELIDLWEENGIDIFSPSLREKDKSKDKPGMTRSARSLYGKLVPKAEEKPEQ